MSMNVAPVKAVMSAVSTVAPKTSKATTKSISLGESIMPRNEEKMNRAKNIIYMVIKSFADKAKAKPDTERNIVDYILIVADKLKDINPIKYAA